MQHRVWSVARTAICPVMFRTVAQQPIRTLSGTCSIARCTQQTTAGVRIPQLTLSGNVRSPFAVRTRLYSSPAPTLSSTQRIKVVLRDYGTVAVVFHTVISLASLGTCYMVVDSGVDVGKVLQYFNVQSSTSTKGASTFAVAYVLHKMFLPVRGGITVASVPLIVRWMRNRGWVKAVAVKATPK